MLWSPRAFCPWPYKLLHHIFILLYWLLNTSDFVNSRPKLIDGTVLGISERGRIPGKQR